MRHSKVMKKKILCFQAFHENTQWHTHTLETNRYSIIPIRWACHQKPRYSWHALLNERLPSRHFEFIKLIKILSYLINLECNRNLFGCGVLTVRVWLKMYILPIRTFNHRNEESEREREKYYHTYFLNKL